MKLPYSGVAHRRRYIFANSPSLPLIYRQRNRIHLQCDIFAPRSRKPSGGMPSPAKKIGLRWPAENSRCVRSWGEGSCLQGQKRDRMANTPLPFENFPATAETQTDSIPSNPG